MSTAPDIDPLVEEAGLRYFPARQDPDELTRARFRNVIALIAERAAADARADERERIAVAMHACLTCGQRHESRMLADETYTWEHPDDGHLYDTALAAEDCDIASAIARRTES